MAVRKRGFGDKAETAEHYEGREDKDSGVRLPLLTALESSEN